MAVARDNPRFTSSSTTAPDSSEWEERLVGVLPSTVLALVLDGQHDDRLTSLATALARRDGARIILYDATASSWWSVPFDDDSEHGGRPLSINRLRQIGRGALADLAQAVRALGLSTDVYLAMEPKAGDLDRIIRDREVDLIVASGALQGSWQRNLDRGRRLAAALLELDPDGSIRVLPPLRTEDLDASQRRVGLRFLGALLLTFVLALQRNRSRSS